MKKFKVKRDFYFNSRKFIKGEIVNNEKELIPYVPKLMERVK